MIARRSRMGDAWADRVDIAGNLVAADRRLGSVWIEAETGKDVGEVDARRANPNPDVSLARLRVGRLADFEDLGRAVTGNEDLAHGTLNPEV